MQDRLPDHQRLHRRSFLLLDHGPYQSSNGIRSIRVGKETRSEKTAISAQLMTGREKSVALAERATRPTAPVSNMEVPIGCVTAQLAANSNPLGYVAGRLQTARPSFVAMSTRPVISQFITNKSG